MDKKVNLCLLKRDLRVDDNRTLFECFQNSEEFLVIFIFNFDFIGSLGDQKVAFLIDVIKNLRKEINLYVFEGNDIEVMERLLTRYRIGKVFTSAPLTFSGKKRNQKLRNFLDSKGVELFEVFDNVLSKYHLIPFKKVYTHFYNEWKNNLDLDVVPHVEYNRKIVFDQDLDNLTINLLDRLEGIYGKARIWSFSFGKQRLENYDFSKYEQIRNFLDQDYSSRLSPYIRLGVFSIRRIYQKAKDLSDAFIKELAWREFWYHIAHYFNELKDLEFQEKRRNINWENDQNLIDSFFQARTGYPIIDAAIIQLKTENWMHNRARLIVGSFLTKHLLTDWRIGERFFSEYLIDYDEVVNIGNWQWVSSVGPDPRPLRIFNPILQAQKFDPSAQFIKKYIPELRKLLPYQLHDPLKNKLPYFEPIVNHYQLIDKIKKKYHIV